MRHEDQSRPEPDCPDVNGREGPGRRSASAQFPSERWKANFVGSPQIVADEIERWFVGRAVDGFILHVTGPREFALFREKVIPIPQAKGLFRTEYEHDTLRGHLGPPVPEHRWAKGPDQIAAE